MKLSAPKNANYAATVVELKTFVDLPNCDNIKAALIFGSHVIVSKDAQAGDLGLFFPVETQLDTEFLANNNLYRKAEWGNVDETKTGFFEQHGRIKCVKFRGHKSEGFFIPTESLLYIDGMFGLDVGDTFDELNGHTICRKYVVPTKAQGVRHHAPKKSLYEDIVAGQFAFHTDTTNLRRNAHKINPDDYISISDKWHGTSVVVSKPLTVRKLNWFESLLKKCGVNVTESVYSLVYSSRTVIKAINGVSTNSKNFYTDDVYGAVAREIADRIPNGYSVYGEIVGFTAGGSPIQKGYHYGCQPGQHKLVVYRVTSTNVDGVVLELGWLQMRQFCTHYGLTAVMPIYYGRAKKLFKELEDFEDDLQVWQSKFIGYLEKAYVNDGLCKFNNNEVPAEGIVLRIDRLDGADAFKLKNFRFLERESKQLDKGEVDLEAQESQSEEVEGVAV
jgi:RNA ligase-like protein